MIILRKGKVPSLISDTDVQINDISNMFLSQVHHVSSLDVKLQTYLNDLREGSQPDIGDKGCDSTIPRVTLSDIGENNGQSYLSVESSFHSDTLCVNENKSHVGLNADTSSVNENKDHISLHGDTSKSCDTKSSSIIEENINHSACNDTPNGPQDKQTVLFYVDLLGGCTHCTAETELYLQTHLVSHNYRILSVSNFIQHYIIITFCLG